MSVYITPLRSARYLMAKNADINDFVCQICSTVVWQPEVCAMCNRCYCRKCIRDYVFRNNTCFCRDKFISDDSYKPPERLKNLRFICPKCKKIVLYADTEEHQAACCCELRSASPRMKSPPKHKKGSEFNLLKTLPTSGTDFFNIAKIEAPEDFSIEASPIHNSKANAETNSFYNNNINDSIMIFESKIGNEYHEYLKMLENEKATQEQKIQYDPPPKKPHDKLAPLELYKPDTKIIDEVNAMIEGFEQEDKLLAEHYKDVVNECKENLRLQKSEQIKASTLSSRNEIKEKSLRKRKVTELDTETKKKISDLLQELSPKEANPDKELIELAVNLQESAENRQDGTNYSVRMNQVVEDSFLLQ